MLRITLGFLFLALTLQTTPNFVQFYEGVMDSFMNGQNKTESNPHRSNCFNVLLNIKDDLSQIYQNTIASEALLSVLGLVDKYEGDLQTECNFVIAEAIDFVQSLAENKGKVRESIEFYYPHLIRDFTLVLTYIKRGDYYWAGITFGGLNEVLQGRATHYAKVEKINPKNYTTFDLEKFLPNFFSPLSRVFRKSAIPPHKISGCFANASSQLSVSGISKDSNVVIILEFFRHFNACANVNQIDFQLLVREFYQPFVENFEQTSLRVIRDFGLNFANLDSRLRNAVTKFYEGDYSTSGRDLNFILTTLLQGRS